MSTLVDLLPQTIEDVREPITHEAERAESYDLDVAEWDTDSFAKEQIRGLVRQVFVLGRPKPAHQVVFSAVDPGTDITAICMQIGLALSAQVRGSTCLVETGLGGAGLEHVLTRNGFDLLPSQESSRFQDASCQLSNELWLVPRKVFLGEHRNGSPGPWLRDRLAALRQEFAYMVLCGPPAGTRSEAALLASLCDGIVLVVQANSTRRVTAQKVKERLHFANARLLGTVLSDRTFPIPEAIYRKL